MTDRYVGAGGNDANSGLSWAQRKLTLTGVEDSPVAANDNVYVGPGVYRELLTCDVSGVAGRPITYIADVTGESTDGVGGVVRISGSNNDQAAVRANCITATSKNFRTFRGFMMDGCTNVNVTTTGCTNWIIEDCTIYSEALQPGIDVAGISSNYIIRRCHIYGRGLGVRFTHTVDVDNTAHLVQNCQIVISNVAVLVTNIGGVTVRNCLLSSGGGVGVQVTASPAVGQTTTVNNCNIWGCYTGLQALLLTDITENWNNIYGCNTLRTNVNVGVNSTSFPPVFQPPILNAGASQVSGFQLPWTFGALSSWSQIRAIAGSNEATEDLFGIARPATAALNSWGPVQFNQAVLDSATFPGMSTIELSTAGRYQYFIPVEAVSTTITVLVQREANYAGVNPQMILKQPGQADITVTDAGGSAAWNTLTHTWIPAATPGWVCIELVSNNTAGAGAFAVYFRNMTASPLGQETQEAWFTDRQPINYVEEATAATAAFSPVGSDMVKGY